MTKQNHIRILLLLILGVSLFFGCSQKKRVVDADTVDEIFWDFSFGMERQAFFDTCFALNDRKIVTQGSKNTSVEYQDTTNFRNLVYVNFYPKFNSKDKLYSMPVRYNYFAWAPWNKELSADSLLLEVVDLIADKEQIEFEEELTIDGKVKFVHYNGPKTISAFAEDHSYVKLTYKNDEYEDK